MTQPANPTALQKIRIVLMQTSHPGNIGATARAMKNMGLEKLYLVQPKQPNSLQAVSRAAGALDVLDRAVIVDTLDEAIADCVWVAGTSARLRTIEWPILEPRECVAQALEYIDEGDIALVFGRENSGLTNEEMEKCNALLHIPTNPEYSSLNVAAAVQVVCYECRLALLAGKAEKSRGKKHIKDAPASVAQREGLYQHMYDALMQIDFFGTSNPDVIMRRLKGLFNRAQMTQREVGILRGVCKAILDSAGRGK